MVDGRTSRFVALSFAALMALAAAPVAAGDDAADLARVSRDGAERELPAAYRAWLEEVEALITARERAAFLDLGGEVERQAFVRRFWQVRDPTAFLLAAPAAAPARLWRPGGAVAGPPADAATACGEGPRLAEEARWI